MLAVDELATNTLRYARGEGTLRTWRENGSLLVEVADGGHIADPLAGRDLPSPDEIGGRGLYLVNQLCDLVQMRSSPEGSVIRVHMHVDPADAHARAKRLSVRSALMPCRCSRQTR